MRWITRWPELLPRPIQPPSQTIGQWLKDHFATGRTEIVRDFVNLAL